MAALDLTFERVREVLDYDPESGHFTWRVDRRGTAKCGCRAGSLRRADRRQVVVDGRAYAEHRLVFFWMTGAWPTCSVDHKDGNGVNNSWTNLRDVSLAENSQNQRLAHRQNSAKLLGVSCDKRRGTFGAFICIDGKSKRLASGLATAEEAHQIYVDAKRRLHPGNLL